MEFNIKNTLNISIEDDEIDTFLEVIELINKHSKRSGFNKSFNKEQQSFMDSLYKKLIGQYEANTNKDDK